MALYFAPINLLSNFVYRHIVLKCGADFVFSELIMVNDLEKAVRDNKLELIKEDIPQTIFQIGVSSPVEVFQGLAFVKEYVSEPLEININMGCPQSTMQQTKVCGGILLDISLIGKLAKALADATKNTKTIPSIKLRLGTDPETVLIHEYLDVIKENGINKVYIHARTLRHSYHTPTRYEFFDGLREKYPDMTLIFNGDVDSFEAFQTIGGGDVLVARAGLTNPLLFQDIKDEIPYGVAPFNPSLKDPNLTRTGEVKLKEKKIQLIRDYLACAKKHNLRKRLYTANVSWLTKGVSGAGKLNTQLNASEDATQAVDIFDDWLKSTHN